jgi:hypothetical protein
MVVHAMIKRLIEAPSGQPLLETSSPESDAMRKQGRSLSNSNPRAAGQ